MRKARTWRWLGVGLAGVVLYFSFLLIFAPAHYFARLVAWLSGDAVSIESTQGTLWRGAGTLQLRQMPAAGGGRLDWTLRAWPLFLGRAVIEVHYAAADIDLRATLHASPTRYRIEDVAAAAPAQKAALLYPAAQLMGLAGQLNVTADSFEILPDDVRGTALIRWQDAGSRLLPVSPAGDYRLQLEGRNRTVQILLTTDRGILNVNANGEWRLLDDGNIRVQGTISPTSPQPALEPILNTLGPPQADGRRVFSYETRLPNALAAWRR